MPPRLSNMRSNRTGRSLENEALRNPARDKSRALNSRSQGTAPKVLTSEDPARSRHAPIGKQALSAASADLSDPAASDQRAAIVGQRARQPPAPIDPYRCLSVCHGVLPRRFCGIRLNRAIASRSLEMRRRKATSVVAHLIRRRDIRICDVME
jgi:hypothetical protein